MVKVLRMITWSHWNLYLWWARRFLCFNNIYSEGGSFPVPLTSCLTSLDWSVLQIKTKIVSSHTADSKPVKQEVNCTVIPPRLVFPGRSNTLNFSNAHAHSRWLTSLKIKLSKYTHTHTHTHARTHTHTYTPFIPISSRTLFGTEITKNMSTRVCRCYTFWGPNVRKLFTAII